MALSEVFYFGLVGSASALLLAIARMCYKSRCKEVSLCCFKIIRDTAAEEREAEMTIEHNIKSSSSKEAQMPE